MTTSITQLEHQLKIANKAYESSKGTTMETVRKVIVVAIEAQITHLKAGEGA